MHQPVSNTTGGESPHTNRSIERENPMIRTCLIVLIGVAVFAKLFNLTVSAAEERSSKIEQLMKDRHDRLKNIN